MKAIVLMSDGIDSPVAAYLMAKKTVEILCLFGKNSTEADQDKAKTLVRTIGEASGGNVRLFTFDHYLTQEAIAGTRPKWNHCLLCKRMMVRVASSLGEREAAEFVVMGDSLGQVASQTLANIVVVEEASVLPIVRPLIGLDKREIEDIGREAGTYEISIRGQAECAYVPKGASIRGNLKDINRLEDGMGVTEQVQKVMATVIELPL